MRKEYLEALEWLLAKETIYRGRTQLPISPALRDIKQYLESIDNANPSEALRKLDDISYLVLNEIDDLKNKELWKSYFSNIKQALLKAQEQEKVLEIIKKKNVDVGLLKRSENWLDYYTRFKHRTGKNTELTEEEFELLKQYFEKNIQK